MGRTSGTYTLTSNIEPKVGAPLDARTIVKLLADLTANNTFEYPYKGMMVFVEENTKTYTLIGTDPTVSANWVESGASQVQTDWNQSDNTKVDYIKNKPENLVQDANYVHTDNNYDASAKNAVDSLGTASTKNIPTSGNASTTEVVMGNDTRLTDARTPVSHNHTVSDISGLGTAATVDTTNTISQGGTGVPTAGAVWSAIDNLPEPMILKGTLGTGGTITTLPTAAADNEGFTYKVITAGTYAGQAAKVGDFFVSCKPVGASAYSWIWFPSGDESFTDTWRNVKVNGTEKLGTGISSGAVDFVNGTNTTVAFDASGNKISVSVPAVSSTSAGVAPKGAAVSSQSQSTKFLREDGSWAAPSYTTNTDTKVTQTATSDNASYEVLFSNTADNTTRTETAKKNSNLKFNPYVGLLFSDYFGSSANITARLTSLNFNAITAPGTGRTAMRLDLASTTATTGLPPAPSGKNSSGFIHTYYWDNGGSMTQIYIPNGDHAWTRNGPQGIMMRGYDNTDGAWKDWTFIPFMTSTPTDGQVVIADGAVGGIKTSGYTIAKSVPSNAVFTDANVTQTNLANTDTNARRVILSGSANDTSETKGVYKNAQLQFTPSTGVLNSPKLTGKINNSTLTGTGTAAQDKGSGVSPRYFPAKWTFNLGYSPSDGDIITITIPVASHTWGNWLSINNGTSYHPVNINYGTTRLTTHFGINNIIQLVFDADGSTASMTPVNGADSVNGSTITGGCWRVVNFYDSNTDIRPSAYCETAAGTAAKAASCTNYALLDKSYVHVLMRYANTSASAITLNINSTGAKAIYINGTASSSSNYTLPAGTYLVYYASNIFYFRTDGKITGDITGNAATVNGLTVQTAVPANAVFTDTNTKVTAVANHYTPTCSGTFTASASGATAAWSIDVVKGVTLQKDAAGHITGISVTSGKIPANPNTDTTYTIATGDANGQIKVTPSSGSAYNVGVKGLGNAAYVNRGTGVLEVNQNSSRSTATTGGWTSMCNSGQTGSPKLPSAGLWWNVISLDNWAGAPTNWMSQLAIPTQAVQGAITDTVWYKHNDASGTNIDSSTWHSLASGAHVGNTCMKVKYTGSTTKLKININSATSWMLSFVVTIYQGYTARKFMISGYNNGASYWHQPKAVLLGSTDNSTANVYFGYDSAWNLWVGFDGGSYTGLSITEVCNGYTQITDFNGLFTISNVSSLATIQTTTTATKPDAATVNGLTVQTAVPANAVFTDTNTKVTAVSNHYTPTCSGTFTASASGATAAWSIDVVKGVTLQKDAAGHITGISVTSGKIPANPNTDANVAQTNLANTDANARRLLLSNSANNTTETKGSYKNAQLYFTPSTNTLVAGNFSGNLNGLSISLVT